MIRRALLWTIAVATIAGFAACSGDDAEPTPTAPPPSPTRAASPTPATAPQATPGSATPIAIAITEPPSGASVQPPFQVSGLANVFEGVLFVQVLDASGELLCERRIQTTQGGETPGTPATFTTRLAFPPPAQETAGTVRAYSRSPRDGSEENVVTRSVNIANGPAAIVITSPTCEQQVQALGSLQVKGTASVFEAALSVELIDAQGTVLQTQHVTASDGAPETGNWTTTFDLSGLPTGSYDIVAYSISARDGTRQNEFPVTIQITT